MVKSGQLFCCLFNMRDLASWWGSLRQKRGFGVTNKSHRPLLHRLLMHSANHLPPGYGAGAGGMRLQSGKTLVKLDAYLGFLYPGTQCGGSVDLG